jgi:hypothetical protein
MPRTATPRSTQASPSRWSDVSLVVRIGAQTFVIPQSALDTYENKDFAAIGKRAVDDFFVSHKAPNVDAALVQMLHIMDGGGA